MQETLHSTDFYGWVNQQTELLKAGNLADLDIDNIAEEIEDMGKSLQRELVSRLKILFMHILKWKYQPGYQGMRSAGRPFQQCRGQRPGHRRQGAHTDCQFRYDHYH